MFLLSPGKKFKQKQTYRMRFKRWIKNESTIIIISVADAFNRIQCISTCTCAVYIRQSNGAKFHVSDYYSTEISQDILFYFLSFSVSLSLFVSQLLIQFWYSLISSRNNKFVLWLALEHFVFGLSFHCILLCIRYP